MLLVQKKVLKKVSFLEILYKKYFFDTYYMDESKISAWKYLNDIKKPIRKLYEILIGNKNIIKNINSWSDDSDWCGFEGNILCFPIYFKRDYRKLTAISTNNDNIKEINSYGYESEFNMCGGDCAKEITLIK